MFEEVAKTCFEYIQQNKMSKANNYKGFDAKFKEFIPEGYKFSLPYQLFLKITSACNLRCKHCFYAGNEHEYSSKNDMDEEELMSLVHYFVDEVNITGATITGGEPFLQNGIYKILEYLSANNIYTNIITNATLIDEKAAQRLSEILNPKISVFTVSLDGVSKETYEQIRGKGTFDRAINGIKNLVRKGFKVSFNYTVTSVNVNEIADLYDFCIKLGVKDAALSNLEAAPDSHLIPSQESVFVNSAALIKKANNDVSFNLMHISIPLIEFLAFDYGKSLLDTLLPDASVGEFLQCHSHQRVEICADGRVFLCAAAEIDELCLGNIKYHSFEDIWSKRFENSMFQDRLLSHSACKDCSYIPLCKSGCMARAYKKYGNLNMPGSSCGKFEELCNG